MAPKMLRYRVSLNGARNGEATPVAIIWVPTGMASIRGRATRVYSSREK